MMHGVRVTLADEPFLSTAAPRDGVVLARLVNLARLIDRPSHRVKEPPS
jgi:hypothetical protein